MGVMKSSITVKEIFKTVQDLNVEIEQYESSLCSLRKVPHNWEEGIEKDTRQPIQLLYATLLDKRGELNLLLDTTMYTSNVQIAEEVSEQPSITFKGCADCAHLYTAKCDTCTDFNAWSSIQKIERSCETCAVEARKGPLCKVCREFDQWRPKRRRLK